MADEQKQQEKKKDGCAEDFAGCGCIILIIIIIFGIVSWGWHIHWLFGLLLLFFLMRL